MANIKLYGYVTSPYVMKVRCFLNFKALDHQFVHVRPGTNEQIKFTGQTQVPVLEIDGEWRKDSSPLGIWLEDLFPERPYLGADEDDRARIFAVDDWVSNRMIPARFREALDPDNKWRATRNGWRLAQVVNGGTPIPLKWRLAWPFVLKKAKFIQDLANTTDRNQPIAEMRSDILNELEAHLADGPFLGGRKTPSMADLSAFPILVSGYLMGMVGPFGWLDRPKLVQWAKAVQSELPTNPLPCDDRFVTRSLSGI
ncbi:MAG: glutathione S-transferase family protein [Pseudomonadota bacterium]